MLGHRLGNAPIEIEDLVQETYLRAARYEETQANRHPKALLLKIAVNLARDQMRRAKARGRPEPLAANDTAPVMEAACEGEQEYLLELKRVVLGLPPDLRHVFVLTRFTGMTYADVARHLGVSVKTVEWRMSKALAICAELLSD
jgi:RNA polymerase sigma-70 factor (ECF subfamily)